MSRLFDVVRELSGQSANITISRPYISLFKGNYTHAAVLSQLVFWSSTKPQGEWFYKSNDELGEELSLTVDQVRNSVRQIKSKLNGVLETARKKANGAPTTHYRIDGDALVDLLFPPSEHISQMDSVDLPNGNGTSTESNRENSQILGSGTSTDSINRSKPYTNKQISDAPSELEASEPPVICLPTNRKDQFYEVSTTQVMEWKQTYPAVNVLEQLRKMKVWSDSNPRKRKTLGGMVRFITAWLGREQDKGRYLAPEQQPQQTKSDGDEIKSKVRQLEMDIDNENQHLLRVMNYGGSEQAIQASKNKIKRLSDERRELLDQLAEVDSDGGEVSWRDGFAA
ncbi:ATPase [Vibrio alginolyticus]|uniref:ATPase n=1 Tax=Vibrio alginolyticus TaxID=663 RepID=UPI001BD66761|nr:ATPase [Vibrio alginolyticus]MBS9903220.1 ATPase [Vibrio alginolyticus]